MLPYAAVSMCPPTTGGKGIKFSGRTASLPFVCCSAVHLYHMMRYLFPL